MADRGSDNSVDFEAEANEPLSNKLKVFKSSTFEPESYVSKRCQAMTEKEIRQLCIYLIDLKKASAEEMRKSVYANYGAFIRTSKEILNLEGQLTSLKNLLSTRAALIQALAEGISIDSLSKGHEGSDNIDIDFESSEPSKMESWLIQYMENLEVLLAEKRVEEALAALDEGERVAKTAIERKSLTPLALSTLKSTITEQRQKLSDQLAEAACQVTIRGVELRSAVQALKKLGNAPRAHTLLLQSHKQKIERNLQGLHPAGTSYGAAYTSSLSQLVFSTIAQAASLSLEIFDEDSTYASELVTWAVRQTESFANLVKRHVLACPAASGSLRPVAECVHICFGHCSLMESRGLALSPVLLRIFRPCVAQALTANLKRIEQCTAAHAAADDWSLSCNPQGMRTMSTASLNNVVGSQPKLSSSAHKFNTMVQELCDDIGQLEGLQFAERTLEGVTQTFNSYINLMINAMPGSSETENLEGSGNRIVQMAETEVQQIGLLANAVLLADELLPRAANKLSSWQQNRGDKQNRPEQRELKRKLQRLVDQLRDSFCRQHALDLIFTEDGIPRLNAEMYISMDGNAQEPEWFPSPIYQELYEMLTSIANIASDVFAGRERFATILLMRLTETIILWLSDDQSFWEEIEQGPVALGPYGLRQFYLDMEFVILFSSQGRYLSRNLHQVIKTIIGRAIEAVAATNIDPYSVLPEDDWFADVAQIAIKMMTGKANFENMGDTGSPTASVSARSVSSVHSHGSN